MSAIPTAAEQASFNEAFLGFKIDLTTGHVVIKACAYCSGKALVEQFATPDRATHGICPRHFQEQMGYIEKMSRRAG